MFERIHNLTERQYRALIGMGKTDFVALTVVFSECSQKVQDKYYTDFFNRTGRKPTMSGSPVFKTPSEKLFLTLYYLKTYPSFDNLGFVFSCSGKTAHTNLYKFIPILENALKTLNVLPMRKFDTVDEFIEFFKEHKDILIDATERVHHRKANYEEQKTYYNGKKKRILLKIQL
jgi:hypothetical protein